MSEKLKLPDGPAAVATLISTQGTTPKDAGAKMWVDAAGAIVGSVTIGAHQATGQSGQHQRSDYPDSVAGPDQQVGNPGAGQSEDDPRIGDDEVGQDDQVGVDGVE